MSVSKITQYLLKFRPTTKWIVEESHIPYLPIDLAVPVDQIHQEWDVVKALAQPHRADDSYGATKNAGWKSLTLYGLDMHDTQNVGAGMHWTQAAEQCPVTVTWLCSMFDITDTTGRIRFMLLEPGGVIVPHKDRDYNKLVEFNIAISHPAGCVFQFKNYGTVPFDPGTVCMMDVGYEHFVVNNSTQPRLHIIAHATLKDQNLIANSYANRYYNS